MVSSFFNFFSQFKILVVAGDGSADWDLGDNLPESIDKISFRIALASDRSGFCLIKSYEGISGTG